MNQMVLEALGFAVRPSDVELTRTGEHTVTVPVAHDTAAAHDTTPPHDTGADGVLAPRHTAADRCHATADDSDDSDDSVELFGRWEFGDCRSAVAGDRLLVLEAGFTTDTDQLRAADDTAGVGARYGTRSKLLSPVVSTAYKKKRWSVPGAVGEIFATDSPPRYVLVAAGPMVLLAERAKWAEGRYLAVNLDGAMERNDRRAKGELETIAALFSADALAPQEGRNFHDELNEKSLKHAVGVSEELRDGVRQSVEILANEVIDLLDEQAMQQRKRKFSRSEVDPSELTRQCLRYLYRLLVLLFAESRSGLGVLPTDDEAYMTGYSLDRLRELVVDELPPGSENGTHLHHSLRLLFRLANRGNHAETAMRQLFVGEGAERQGSSEIYLQFPGLDAALFEEEADPYIGRVELRNKALHRVLRLLMLAQGKKKRDQAGFVSYAALGVNQLGAVYEDLMAYSGFFADEDLMEVAKNGDPKNGTWMLPTDESYEYPEEVFVTRVDEITGQREPVIHEAGSFVYRLSGRDRQRSASYYTPEVLTECVVHHTLAEMLGLDAEVMRGLGFDAPDSGSAGITKAEDLLRITICEPALGSGAFANEAINQLSAEYLRRRQQELGERLDPDRYQQELAKTKAHFALNQTYGVDLNATAVELAEVSLWLNCIHPGLKQPWFGMRLRQGNSLIGCRRATWTTSQLKTKPWKATKTKKTNITPPEPRPLTEPLAPDEIHHFLLPGHGWAAIADQKDAKTLAPNQTARLKQWRKQILAAPGPKHAQRLTQLAAAVETAWTAATEMLHTVAKRMHRDFNLYGHKLAEPQPKNPSTSRAVTVAVAGRDEADVILSSDGNLWTTSEHKEPPQANTPISKHQERIPSRDTADADSDSDGMRAVKGGSDEGWTLSRKEAEQLLASNRTPLGRLRALMDAWIGLWYWPMTTDAEPPNWEQWLTATEQLIGVEDNAHADQTANTDSLNGMEHQLDLLSLLREVTESQPAGGRASRRKPLEKLKTDHPWLEVTLEAAKRADAWHWELEFATVFYKRGGFNLQIGNPPWVRPDWKEALVLAETDPWWGLLSKQVGAPERKQRRNKFLADSEFANNYLDELVDHTAMRACLSSTLRWPLLSGLKTDLYLNFIDIMLRHASATTGYVGMVHPDTLYTDKKAGSLRDYIYHRLQCHFNFSNELRLFTEIHHAKVYGIHIYGPKRETVQFLQVAGLYHPATITHSFNHNGAGELPGSQLPSGGHDLRPHRTRLVRIDETVLRIWRDLRDELHTPISQSCLMFPLTQTEFQVQNILSKHPKVKDYQSSVTKYQIYSTTNWDETKAVRDEIIHKNLATVNGIEEVILKGADIELALPLAREPNSIYRSNNDILSLDLLTLPKSKVPRTVYNFTDESSSLLGHYHSTDEINDTELHDLYRIKLGMTLWDSLPYTAYFRHAHRRMCNPSNRRSLICAMLPPGPNHVDSMISMYIDDNKATTLWNGMLSAILIDYIIRVAQTTHIGLAVCTRLPAPPLDHPLEPAVLLRTLRLNCLMDFYAPLWGDLFTRSWQRDSWSDPSFGRRELGDVEPEWTMATPLRCDDERRRALVELDALVALMLGVSAEQLCAVYRASFGVLRKYEHRMVFDAQGYKICGFYQSAGYRQAELQGRAKAGQLPPEWRSVWKLYECWEEDPGSVDWRGHFEPPFVRADRELEMTQAFNEFQRRLDAGEYS